MPKHTLSKAFVASVEAPTTKTKVTFSDTATKGLVLEVRRGGGRTYFFRYHDERGRQKNVKIGDATAVDLEAAREAAEQHRTTLAVATNPGAGATAQGQAPSLAAFVQDHYLPYVKSYKSSWKTDELLLRKHVLPTLGDRPLDRIATYDLVQLVNATHNAGLAPASVNRVIIILRYVYNLAIKWETPGIAANPARAVAKLPEENKLERCLTAAEVQRLMDALATSPNPDLVDIILFLLLTGARRGEVLSAEWKDIDLDRRIWTLPKTKSRSPRRVHLSDQAIELIQGLRTRGVYRYLFVSRYTGEPYKRIYNQWDRARKLAGLPTVRIHDLRHSFASFLINSGRSLYEVQRLLGHHSIKVTERYAHLQNDTLVAAANYAGDALAGLRGGPDRQNTGAQAERNAKT